MIRFGTSNLVPKTTNTDFVFLNPTGLTLTLEYAFRQPARRVNCATDLQKNLVRTKLAGGGRRIRALDSS